ncbi:MAG: hypothetical protein V2B20_27805 [Pseudomonadota bacterium]
MKSVKMHKSMDVPILLGVGHFVMDFSCALTVVSLFFLWNPVQHNYYQLVIFYNLAAFGSQPFWGWLLDRSQAYGKGIIAGFICIGLGALAAEVEPRLSVLFLGFGNALFHVGAGALVYIATGGRASGPGLFVAPGGLGLLAGMMLAPREVLSPLWLPPLLGMTALILHRLVPVVRAQEVQDVEIDQRRRLLSMVLLLLLLVVSLRSFSGFAFAVPWRGVGEGVILLALASFLGKACGGFLADRLGWRISCSTLLLFAGIVGIGYNVFLPAACLALFAFQSTTGVTLAAIQSLFPGRPAFSFGLPCIALLAGALPFFLPQPVVQFEPYLTVIICLGAALATLGALTFYKNGGRICCN